MKYPHWHNPEERLEMKQALTEQAYNNILEDPDRIEKYIEENADVIQDILYRHNAYKLVRDDIETEGILMLIGAELVSHVLLGLENMAEEDAEEQL